MEAFEHFAEIESHTGITENLADFSLDLIRHIGFDQSNVIFSPLSIVITLAMVLAGTGGKTKFQIRSAVFGNETFDEIIHSTFERIMSESFANLKIDPNGNSFKTDKTSLKLANGLFPNRKLVKDNQIQSSFINVLRQSYKMDSSVQTVDYSNTQNAAKLINNWVKQRTNGKIHNVVSEDQLSAETVMVLVNAIHFKALWNHDSEKGVMMSEKFYQNERDFGRPVQMMQVTDNLPIYSDPNGKFNLAILPYANTRFNFFLLVPTQIGEEFVREQLQNLTGSQLLNLLQTAVENKRETEIWLPIFNVESSFSLKETLKTLGIAEMFSERANFSGISAKPLTVSDVMHEAMISVDENGTEAAAATASAINYSDFESTNESVVIKANRPFVMGIWEKSQNILLFLGKISVPQ